MFTPKQILLSAVLCMALTAPTQSSAPDDGVATNSTSLTAPTSTFVWDPEATATTKKDNINKSFMSLEIWPLQQLCQILAENDAAATIIALGQTSIHLAGRLLRWKKEYPNLFNDEDTRINNPTMQQAIRVDLRKAINAREKALATLQKASGDQSKPKGPLLDHWKELLGEDAPLQNLCFASDMLRPQNVARLGKNGLLEMLTKMEDKAKTLALGAYAVEIFTSKIHESDQASIIKAALKSSRPLSEYAALGAACQQHLFMRYMNRHEHRSIIIAALQSSRPVSAYVEVGVACKQNLFTTKMERGSQTSIIEAVLESTRPLWEVAALGTACQQHLFTEKMGELEQSTIIINALKSSRPLSDYAALSTACQQHLFTEKMGELEQGRIIIAALQSSRPVPTYAALNETLTQNLCAQGMGTGIQTLVITSLLPLSDAQLAQLVVEFRTKPEGISHQSFIRIRARELQEKQQAGEGV